MMIDQVYD